MARKLSRRGALGLLGAGGAAALAGGVAAIASETGGATPANAAKKKKWWKHDLCGKILYPGDEGFEDEIKNFNLSVTHHPKVVVVAGCAADVKFAVQYAVANNLPIAVQSTGHGVSVPADDAMLINTRLLNQVSIQAHSRTATLGGGAQWAPVLQQAAQHNLAPLIGSSPIVGANGYLSGGGLPVLGRQFGFSADRVKELEVVTVDGKRRKVTPWKDADLFYAVRGGKSNFGIITKLKVKLLDQSRLFGGNMLFPGPAAADVFKAYLRWAKDQPKEMSSSIAIAHNIVDPNGNPLPLAAAVRIAFTGSQSDGEAAIQPLRALGPVVDTVREMPYTELGSIHQDPDQPVPSFYRSALTTELDEAVVDRLMNVIGDGTQMPPGAVEFRHMGGALANAPRHPNPVGFRSQSKWHFFTGIHLDPSQIGEVRTVHSRLMYAISPWDLGAPWINFLGYNDTSVEGTKRAYETADYDKLRTIKKKYDPQNRLRVNFNIPPA